MSAQSIANRSHRHRPSDDDAGLARALEWTHWAQTNLRVIVAVAVVVVLGVGGLIYYRYYQTHRKAEAAIALMNLERTVNPANPALAARDIEKFVHRYDGTPAAEEARIALAQMYLQQNEAAKAVDALKGAESRVDASPVGAQEAMLLAAARSAAGDTTGAIQTYLAVADNAKLDFRQQEALENAAMLRMQSGDYANAVPLYERLIKLTGADPEQQQGVYQMRLAEARAKAGAK